MKPFIYLLAALALISTVEAKKEKETPREEQQRKEKEKEGKRQARDAVKAVLEKKDTNHDGSLTREEYLTGETDAEAANKRFDEFNKNGDRSLSKKELEASLGL